MGGKLGRPRTSSSANSPPPVFEAAAIRAEGRLGRLAVRARYHHRFSEGGNLTSKCLEDDYVVEEASKDRGGEALFAVNRWTNGRFALKRFDLSTSMSTEQRASIEAEAEILLCADHPHVARLVDLYETTSGGTPCLDLVFERGEGGDLYDRLSARGAFPETEARAALHQMLLAVRYLHCLGVAHRGLQLESFFFDMPRGQHLKLGDFSRACVVGDEQRPAAGRGALWGTGCGDTPSEFQAPEASNRGHDASRCDLWSLGVIAFALLAGYMPFGQGECDFGGDVWSRASFTAMDFVRELLAVNPSFRPTAQEALQHRWMQNPSSSANGHAGAEALLAALRIYSAAPRLCRGVAVATVWSFTSSKQAMLRETFLELDVAGNGFIELRGFKKALGPRCRHFDERELRHLFSTLDATGSGEITYSEFLSVMSAPRMAQQEGHLRDVFRRFDRGGAGLLTGERLEEVVAEDGGAELLRELGFEGDAAVSFDAFAAAMRMQGSRSSSSRLFSSVLERCGGGVPKLFAECCGGRGGGGVGRGLALRLSCAPALAAGMAALTHGASHLPSCLLTAHGKCFSAGRFARTAGWL